MVELSEHKVYLIQKFHMLHPTPSFNELLELVKEIDNMSVYSGIELLPFFERNMDIVIDGHCKFKDEFGYFMESYNKWYDALNGYIERHPNESVNYEMPLKYKMYKESREGKRKLKV